MQDLRGVVAVKGLDGPEQRVQTWCRGLDQKLHLIGMFNPPLPAVVKTEWPGSSRKLLAHG